MILLVRVRHHHYQEIYKEPDFRSVGQSVVRAAMALHESVAFVLAQMTIEGQRAAESDVQLKTDLAKQRHENGRLTMQVRWHDHAGSTTMPVAGSGGTTMQIASSCREHDHAGSTYDHAGSTHDQAGSTIMP